MEIEKQLDALLDFHRNYKHGLIYSNKSNPYGTVQNGDSNEKRDAIKILIDNYGLLEQGDFIDELYNQLTEEQYIRIDFNGNYILTVKGLLFEGYEQSKINNDYENDRRSSMEGKVFYLTVLLTFGTVGLLAWEILKYFLENNHCLTH